MSKKLNILIVDDEPDILNLMADEFNERGHNVSTAKCGNEAIEVLKNKTFHVVLSDFKMPNGNGMVLLNFISTMLEKPMFYFVSGHADMSVSDCLNAGASDFFTKPFDLEHLILEVEKRSVTNL